MTALEYFRKVEAVPCDIGGHLDTLAEYGQKCQHITEFGVRGGNSTAAWLLSHPKTLVCYDIEACPVVDEIAAIARNEKIDFHFYRENTTQAAPIAPTDLLFIDTRHDFATLQSELARHASRVSKYIILHDTTTWGWIGEGNGEGLLHALMNFLLSRPEWRILEHFEYCNGLTVLGRV